MSVLSTGLAKTSAGGYDIDNSLRFNDDDSANLTWLQGTSNRRTWTWSGWVKRGNLTNEQPIITWQNTSENSDWDTLEFSTTDTIRYYMSGASSAFFVTNQVFRDTSAWYHICLAVDTTQATASNRVKLYVNGEQVTSFSTATYPSQNYDTWTNLSGRYAALGSNIYADTTFTKYLDGYLSEVNFIDGQALTPDNFGETGDYGEWKPIEYTGTYGTNGFYLDFSNSGSLGTDASSNTNNWTVNNLAATDQMLDSPTNNFCTWNPLMKGGRTALSEGNLKVNNTSAIQNNYNGTIGTQLITSGKWYWEHMYTNPKDGMLIGMFRAPSTNFNAWLSDGDGGNIWVADGAFHWGSRVEYDSSPPYLGITVGNNNILQIAFDADTGDMYVGVNGTWANSGSAVMTGISLNGAAGWVTGVRCNAESGTFYSYANFGQDSSFAGNKTAQGNQDSNSIGDFYYTPPTGFLALCTSNLPDPAVIPSEHFNTVTYAGTGAAKSVTGVGFQPDITWFKQRDITRNHLLQDVVRGVSSFSHVDLTEADGTASNLITSFDSDGFSLGTSGYVNASSGTYVAWNWKAGGSDVLNENGTIDSQVSANADAGFSIVSYTGTGSNATVGHGLSVTPEMVIVKNRNYVANWACLHSGIASDYETDYIPLNNATTSWDNNAYWNDTKPTNSLFSVGTDNDVNRSGDAHIAYCFHSVDGYSKVGSYTGNGSSDGTFVYTSFKPKYVMIKSSTLTEQWNILDSERGAYNVIGEVLLADSSAAEVDSNRIDFTSNGFKIRAAFDNINNNGATFIYLAFAEVPFKFSNAR